MRRHNRKWATNAVWMETGKYWTDVSYWTISILQCRQDLCGDRTSCFALISPRRLCKVWKLHVPINELYFLRSRRSLRRGRPWCWDVPWACTCRIRASLCTTWRCKGVNPPDRMCRSGLPPRPSAQCGVLFAVQRSSNSGVLKTICFKVVNYYKQT